MNRLIHGGDIYSQLGLGNDIKIIDFSANINPFGLPDGVKIALVENIDIYSSYPDPLCRELRTAIGFYERIKPESIVCGNGAADLIYRIAFSLRPKKTLVLAPTFSEYEIAVKSFDGDVDYYFLVENKNFCVEEDILNSINSGIDMMFICNPNNPTGIPIKRELMIHIAERCKIENVVLVVDECFIDFLEDEKKFSISSETVRFNNLIILKAFTKVYAMAGIRLGYLLCGNKEIVEKINNMGQPWSVSSVASKCGVAALLEMNYVIKTKEYIKINREYLVAELFKLGFKVYDSKANFIFFRTDKIFIREKLSEIGILIRSCDNYVGLNNKFFRIAVKSKEDNEILIRGLNEIIKRENG